MAACNLHIVSVSNLRVVNFVLILCLLFLLSQMITSYESQLQSMRVDLKEAYMSIEEEQLRRQQLEENLRRLFLKNMTTMNFEALSLFQNSHNMVETAAGATAADAFTTTTPAASHSVPLASRRDASPNRIQHQHRAHGSNNSTAHMNNTFPAGGRGAAATNHSSPQRHHSPPPGFPLTVDQQQQQFQEQIEHLISSGSGNTALLTPAVRSPPLYAAIPPQYGLTRPAPLTPPPLMHSAAAAAVSYQYYSGTEDEFLPRAPLSSGGGGSGSAVAHTRHSSNGNHAHAHTVQLSEAYRASMSTTNRLAHNTPSPQQLQQQQQQQALEAHHTGNHQQHHINLQQQHHHHSSSHSHSHVQQMEDYQLQREFELEQLQQQQQQQQVMQQEKQQQQQVTPTVRRAAASNGSSSSGAGGSHSSNRSKINSGSSSNIHTPLTPASARKTK